jgi:aryl-alcohol dehydrogenase-like predicted oxidoreductase
MSFLKSNPRILTTIAGTSKIAHLSELLEADKKSKPLAPELSAQIKALHHKWFANS